MQLHASRASADVKIRWDVAQLAPNHWSNDLPLPEGFAFAIRHKASGLHVYHSTFVHKVLGLAHELVADDDALDPGTGFSYLAEAMHSASSTRTQPRHAATESFVDGAGLLFLGETYVVEVDGNAGVLPTHAAFMIRSHMQNVIRIVLRRATVGLTVRIRGSADGAMLWRLNAGLPSGIDFEIAHLASSQLVTRGCTGKTGQCVVPVQDDLFVNEAYLLRVAPSYMTEGGTQEFVLSGPRDVRKEDGTWACVSACVEIVVQRTIVAVLVQLQGTVSLGAGHWACEQLTAPAFVPLRVSHTATQGFVCEVTTDECGVALIDGRSGLHVNEMYSIEVPQTKFVRRKRVDFTAEIPRTPVEVCHCWAFGPTSHPADH